MTASSGADQPTPDEYAGHVGSCRMFYAERRCTCGANLTDDQKAAAWAQVLNARVTFADQPTLRDQLAEELRDYNTGRGGWLSVEQFVERRLLPLIEADRERAKAEGGAEALEKCYREDHTTVAKLNPIEQLTCFVVKTEDMVIRAAALRGSTGGAAC